MKAKRPTIPIVSALPFCILLVITGCSKSANPPLPTNGTLSITAGTTNFTAAQVEAAYSSTLGFVAVLGYTIQGHDTTSVQLDFAYLPPVGVTFSSDSTETGLTYIAGSKRYDGFLGLGKVVMQLTAADTVEHKLSGTFSATLIDDDNSSDSLIITNGKFTSTYTAQ
ncbi:MAG TPA: hypothetical protein VNU70_13340 [Puia sp.]|nr:hypothetical protein [Puia sp.]